MGLSVAQIPDGYNSEPVFTSFDPAWDNETPVGTTFNADGSKMFVWFRDGLVYMANWNGSDYVLQSQTVLDIRDEVASYRDFGFLGFCLDPDFDSNGLVYMVYMVDREHLMDFGTPNYDPNDNDYFEATITRVTRYQLILDSGPVVADYNSRFILLGESASTGVPLLHESHAGATILFGRDGTLLVSTGDNASYSGYDLGSNSGTYYQQALNDGILKPEENVGAFRSQQIQSLCGKVLRLDPATGDGVPSNPFYNASQPRSAESRMYAMGLRNPFRMSIAPGTGSTNPADGDPGRLYVVDVGWGTWEDLHIFDKPGMNGGWPLYEGLKKHNGYYDSGVTNPFEGNQLFKNQVSDATSHLEHTDPAMRRFIHNRPEVAWKHGVDEDARVPDFDGTTPTDVLVGANGSPTTGVIFRGNTGVSGLHYTQNTLGSFYKDKYFFSDYTRNWVNVATLKDGSGNSNWLEHIERFADYNFGSGIVHMSESPMDGYIYYVNIYDSTVYRITFMPPAWTTEPTDMTVEADGTPDPGNAFSNWLNSFDGAVTCGNETVSHNSSGLSDDCGSTGSETVRFTLSDDCGNEIFKDVTFTIEDTTNPTFNEALPSDTTVNCDNIPTEETLTASDTGGTANVAFSESTTAGSCPGSYTLTRTWTATDECGNETTHEQTITVEDTQDPIFNEALPGDTTVSCDNIPTEETLTANDNCGTANVTFSESTTAGSCPGNYTITRTWTATDECGNETIHEQTITVADTEGPNFNETLPADLFVSCVNIPSAETLTASDNCGTAGVSYNETSIAGSCIGNYELIRTWTATDECGNETIHEQTITVQDLEDPTWTIPPTDLTVTCDILGGNQDEFDSWINSFNGIDNCGGASVYNDYSGGSIDCGESYLVEFTLEDECGNQVVTSATFTVEETLGIEEDDLISTRIYPNPAETSFYISGRFSDYNYIIYDLSGRIHKSGIVSNEVPVNIDLSSGMYFVKINSNDMNTIKKLVVK